MGIDLAFWGNEGFTPSHYLNATNLLDTNNVYSSFNRGFTWIWDNTITYNHSVGKHNMSYLAGHSAQEVNGRYIGGNKRDVPTQDFQDATIDYARNELSEQVYGGKWERYAIESYFARANYDYDGKYVATAMYCVQMLRLDSDKTTVGVTSRRFLQVGTCTRRLLGIRQY